ncbi:hypothetical protein [Streptomyces sp. NPDC014995]|uniref:hypothetical protein n=1 Tax=Streptomyces sp. NPDC014995 TaxID=3364936 RepID=UPI0036FC8848
MAVEFHNVGADATVPPRLSAAQAFTTVSFTVLGGALRLAGMPLGDVFALLGGCGALGAATVVAMSGGRRRLSSVAAAVVRAADGK